MNNFLSRLNFLIDRCAEGKPFVFAKKVGIPAATFQSYIKGRIPKADQLLRIHISTGVDLNWLLSGEGNPFHCGAEATHTHQAPERSELLRMASEILDSRSEYCASLAANIRSFHAAMTTERRLEAVEGEVAYLKRCIRTSADRLREGDPEEKKEEILQKRAISSG